MHLPPEFKLVAACCRWPPSPERDAAVRDAAAAAGIDWNLAGRIAERHRVEGLVWAALVRTGIAVPESAAAPLRAAAARIARQNLALTAESLRLAALLDGAGLNPLFVKGVSLGALVYGSLAPKMGWDIDLLVSPKAVEAAAALLEQAGYRLAVPAGPRGRQRLRLWHAHWKESVWTASEGRRFVELHTRLSDNPMLLPGVGPDSPRRLVEVARGRFLSTLPDDELFAYLCVHGASSAWFRLKWIADLAALIGDSPPAEIERLYRRSQTLGAGRAAAQALLLCERLFATPLPAALDAELRADRVNRWLLAIALRKLAGRALATELHDTRLGTATIHLMQLGLLPGFRFKLAELRRQLVSPVDRVALPLPRPLAFLYPLVALSRRLGAIRPVRGGK
ncbi:MAG TPA: nucleotidyltransferase family protein [Allosphingosinicella sp.]|nr:nucleotidyltransferase family protein [Allosphingosinicella sp.]